MGNPRSAKTGLLLSLLLTTTGLGACNAPTTTGSLNGPKGPAQPIAVTDAERDCLGRAMYFESNRSDAEGLLAVGTVVMNRLEAAAFPNGGICAVVGQPRQFATGVLTKPMAEKDLQKVAAVTDAVLDGERHPKVGRAMYFHTAGLRFPYNNMHYVAVAGGNAFYEKRKSGAVEQAAPSAPPTALAFASAEPPAIPAAAPAAPETGPSPAIPAASTTPVHRGAPVRVARVPAPPKSTAMAQISEREPPRSRLALTPAALAPEPPIPPTVLNLPRP